MPGEDHALAQALAAGGPNVVLPEDLEHLGAHEARVERDAAQRVDDDRAQHVDETISAERARLPHRVHRADRQPAQLDAQDEHDEKTEEEFGQ